VRSLSQITKDDMTPSWRLAVECLHNLNELPYDADDVERANYRAAAQTFALLSISDQMTTTGAARNLADVVALAGDVQS
jgi:hypothetical protein